MLLFESNELVRRRCVTDWAEWGVFGGCGGSGRPGPFDIGFELILAGLNPRGIMPLRDAYTLVSEKHTHAL